MTRSSTRCYTSMILAPLLLAAACNEPPSAAKPAGKRGSAAVAAEDERARVNGVPITRWDVEATAGRGHGGAPASRDRQVLETVVTQELARQEAERLGLSKERHLREQLARIEATARAQQRRALYEAFMQREVTNKAKVSDAELKAYWDKHRAELRTSIHVLLILRRGEAAIKQAQAQLQAGKDFEAVAKDRPGQTRHGSSGHRFWDMGFMRWARLPQPWRAPLRKLGKGQVSGVIKGPADRFWILKLVDRREDAGGTFEANREAIRQTLTRQRVNARRAAVLGALRAKATVEYSRGRPQAN